MWPFRSVPKPSPKRLVELEADVADVQVELKWTKKQIVDLNARLATVQRQQKSREDAPQEEIEEEEVPQVPLSTAHLARRFRGF